MIILLIPIMCLIIIFFVDNVFYDFNNDNYFNVNDIDNKYDDNVNYNYNILYY